MPHSKQIFVKPAPGLLVRDPETRVQLKAEGEWKDTGSYWRRRLDDEDVILAVPPKADKKEVSN